MSKVPALELIDISQKLVILSVERIFPKAIDWAIVISILGSVLR